MSEFMLIFRSVESTEELTKKELMAQIQPWEEWIGGIAAQGKLVSTNKLIDHQGRVLKPGGVITDGPFVEIKETLGGYLILNAENLEEATTLAHGCPVLSIGGNVEIREIHVLE